MADKTQVVFGNGATISLDSTIQPYEEFEYVIAAGDAIDFRKTFDYFCVLELSGGSLGIRFAFSATETVWTGAGISFKSPVAIQGATFRNTGATPMTLRVAIALGDIYDRRLTVSSNINVVTPPATFLGTQERKASSFGTGQVTVGVAATSIIAANANRKSLVITAPSTQNLYIGNSAAVTTATGLIVPAGTSIGNLESTAEYFGICSVAAQTVSYMQEIY